jgi:hypothetical protein
MEWTGEQNGELFGRAISHAGDVDADGVPDVAVSAPWWRLSATEDQVGRVEIRSGADGHVLMQRRGVATRDTLGWHMTYSPHAAGREVQGLVLSALHATVDGIGNAGRLDVMVYGR